MTPIETDRLVLRRYEERDIAELVPLATEWDVTRWLPQIPHPYTAENGRTFVKQAQSLLDERRDYQLAITGRATGALIGTVAVHVASRSIPELGYWLGKPFWGQGFATEAARAMVVFARDRLGLSALMARVFEGNTASERVLIKNGFALKEFHDLPERVRGHNRYGVYQRDVR